MNKTEFIEAVKARLEEDYPDVLLSTREIEKFQESYTGLDVRRTSSNIAPSFNMDDFYEYYVKSDNFEEVYKGLKELIDVTIDAPDFDTESITNYEISKKKLYLQVVNTEINKDMLENIPHIEMEDLSLVARIFVDMSACESNGKGSIIVNNQILREFEIPKMQLFEDAKENSPLIMEPVLQDIFGMLCNISKKNPEELSLPEGIDETTAPMYVATNKYGTNGASVIAYPGFLEKCEERFGSIYILPSSKHEVIIIPDSICGPSAEELKEMVVTVNATEVPPQDILSDSLYHFDSEEGFKKVM